MNNKKFIKAAIIFNMLICSSIIILSKFYWLGYIPSESMAPTLNVGQRVICDKTVDEYNRQDIIVFEFEEEDGTSNYVKRIIGLPGDVIEIKFGIVFVNGGRLNEEYLTEGTITNDKGTDTYIVPEGHVFVLGDNRGNSCDSRNYGFIDIDDIQGKVIYY